jgi:hypothetical protein
MSAQVLAAPNVFVQYECDRMQAAPADPDQSLFETYARFHEDLIVEALLRGVLSLQGRGLESVAYLDVGARHPIKHSNTYLFYRKWSARGALAPAEPSDGEGLARVRVGDEIVATNAWQAAAAGRPIDFLSLDRGGETLAQLASLDLADLRPAVIQCAVEPGADQALCELARERGYALAGRTDASLILLDAAAAGAPPARRRLDSFDVFDTLIARRCIEPHRVFEKLERRSGIEAFAERRRLAEAAVAAGPYGLADIYARLGQDLGLSEAVTHRLMELEIEAELEEVVPIAENLAKVNDGDLLISDMYLGETVIRRLLAKAGLDRKVGLIVSAHGKRSGEVWPKVKAQFHIGRHLGDNDHADVAMPARFGLTSAKTTAFAPSPVEGWLIGQGVRDLAELLREARLATWEAEGAARRLQLVQIQLNFPILLLSSLALMRLTREVGASHLLFSSRDCHMWLDLHRALAARTGKAEAPAEYFFTSRRARTEPSWDYLDYARKSLGDRGLMVDVCGSGWSTALLFDRLGLSDRHIFLMHHIATPDAYTRKAQAPDVHHVHAVVGPAAPSVNNMILELCNTADHGSVRDVARVAGAWLPHFEPDLRPEPIRRRAADQARYFATAVGLLKDARLDHVLALSTPEIERLVTALYGQLCQDPTPVYLFAEAHLEEDRTARQAMGLI